MIPISFFLIATLLVINGQQIGSQNARLQDAFTKTCGFLVPKRIRGGKLAEKYPWMAALIGTQGRNFCGGSLITNKHILTAAHCVDRITAKNLRVRLGSYDFGSDFDPGATDYDVGEIQIHPNFERRSLVNDIALVKLKYEVEFSDFVIPICFPPERGSFQHLVATVAGFGRLGVGAREAKRLMEVQVPIWNNTACARTDYGTRITDRILCAGEPGKDACEGDSGGPLMLKGARNQYSIVGVVSAGYNCGSQGYPGLYSRVNKYMEWMDSLINPRSAKLIVQPIKVSGAGIERPMVDQLNPVIIDFGSIKLKSLRFRISGPSNANIVGSPKVNKGRNIINYRVSRRGHYTLSIIHAGKAVPGSPFKVLVE